MRHCDLMGVRRAALACLLLLPAATLFGPVPGKAAPTAAQLQQGGLAVQQPKVVSAKLWIESRAADTNACSPNPAYKLKVTIDAKTPALYQYRIRAKSGFIIGPFQADPKKLANGLYRTVNDDIIVWFPLGFKPGAGIGGLAASGVRGPYEGSFQVEVLTADKVKSQPSGYSISCTTTQRR